MSSSLLPDFVLFVRWLSTIIDLSTPIIQISIDWSIVHHLFAEARSDAGKSMNQANL